MNPNLRAPTLLPHPGHTNDLSMLSNKYVNIFEHYGNAGFMSLLYTSDDKVNVLTGDWSGNIIDLDQSSELSNICINFYNNNLYKLINVMASFKLTQIIYYFSISDEVKLCDVRLSANKFASPTFVRDVIGRVLPVLNLIVRETLTDDLMQSIIIGKGRYGCNLVIKPNILVNGSDPGYVEVVR